MNKKFSLLRTYLTGKRLYLLIAALVVVGSVVAAFSFSSSGVTETISPSAEDLVRTVKIAGKVVPREKVDLSFEVGGTVASISRDVGQQVSQGETLIRLDSGAISAELLGAKADLASAEAKLAKLDGAQTAETSIVNAKRSVTQAIRDAYTTASDAIENKSDQLFIDPRSVSPRIAGSFDGYNDLRDSVNTRRIGMTETLEKWQKLVTSLGSTYSQSELDLSKRYLSDVTSFISDLSTIVNVFEVTNYMPQTTIDAYKADMLSARNNLDKASQSFIDVENNLSSLLSDVPVQVANVEAARANVLNLQFKLNKSQLVSPMGGIVSRQDAKVGAAVSAGTSLVSVISQDNVIEAYIPEVLIAGVKSGNRASITLDAYGTAQIFEAQVTQVDPAETIRDGVSTYKVKLSFNKQDERIRSGMTANIEIETFRKTGTLLIPKRAIDTDEEGSFVLVQVGDKEVKVLVTLGEEDSRGNVEVISGLSATDRVVVNPAGN